MNDNPGNGEPPKPKPITAKDVASSTAVGAASRFGVARHRARVAEGAGAGAAGGIKRRAKRSSLLTVLLVVIVLVGTLALMLLLGR